MVRRLNLALAACAIAAVMMAGCDAHDRRPFGLPVRPGKLDAFPSNHTDNWAVVVGTSRFWHNYRHTTNAVEVYRMLRDSGIPDDHIVLMLADDIACEPRNAFPGTLHATGNMKANVMCADVEVDYAGDSVTAINFMRVLSGRVPAGTPRRQQIFPGPQSNIFIYLSGHSGAHFLKFHDYDFMTSYDFGDTISAMHKAQRYHRLLFTIDTCQAETIYTHIEAPNAVSLASARAHQNSMSHAYHSGGDVANSFVDGFPSEAFREFFWRFTVPMGSEEPPAPIAPHTVNPFRPVFIPKDEPLVSFFAALDPKLAQSEHVWSHEFDAEGMGIVHQWWKLRDFFGPGYQAYQDPKLERSEQAAVGDSTGAVFNEVRPFGSSDWVRLS
jgi:phosphatidylinositol glycan class K